MKRQPLSEQEKLDLGLYTEMGQVNWRHRDDKDAKDFERAQTQILCEDPTKTEAHHAIDLDLNNIIKRFGIKDGSLPPAIVFPPESFGDFTEQLDLRTAMDRTKDANDRFNLLPAKLRAQFGNDPGEMYRFVSDPKNADEAIKLGLLHKKTRAPEHGSKERPFWTKSLDEKETQKESTKETPRPVSPST